MSQRTRKTRKQRKQRKPSHDGPYMLDVFIPYDGGPPQVRLVPVDGPESMRAKIAELDGCDPDEVERIDLPEAACFN